MYVCYNIGVRKEVIKHMKKYEVKHYDLKGDLVMIETYEGKSSTEILSYIFKKFYTGAIDYVPTNWVTVYCITTNRRLRNKSYYKICDKFENKK